MAQPISRLKFTHWFVAVFLFSVFCVDRSKNSWDTLINIINIINKNETIFGGTETVMYRLKQNHWFVGGVVHSFDGTAKEAEDLLKLHERIFFGINGCSLKTELNCNIMAALPLERLMIETDAPWCDIRPTHFGSKDVVTKQVTVDKKKHSPELLVKGRNEPCNIVQVLEVIAAQREISNTWALAETLVNTTNGLFFPSQ